MPFERSTRPRYWLLAGSAACLLALTSHLRAEILVGRVVHVADGDTVTVLDDSRTQHRVRIAGIDAPEKRQPYANRSKAALSAFVMGQVVSVDWYKQDRYQRIVGNVHVAQVDAGLELVKAGLAWHYKAYQREQPPMERQLYAHAEEQARSARRGLWADRSPQPPWEFRRERRERATPPQEPHKALSE
jgi:endonuclease YncB( thermonuclease family)